MRRARGGTFSMLAFGALTVVGACSTFSSDEAVSGDAGADQDAAVSADSQVAPDVTPSCVCDDGVSKLDSCTVQ